MPTKEQAIDELVRRGAMTREEGAQKILELRRPEETRQETVLNPVVAEAAGALNRGVAAIPDFFIDAANAGVNALPEGPRRAFSAVTEPLRAVIGQEGEGLPRVGGALEQATGGTRNFMEPGLARTVVQEGGEFIPGAATAVLGARQVVPRTMDELAEASSQEAARVGGLNRVGDTRGVRQAVEQGRVVEDKTASAAIKQGFDEGVVATIKAAPPKTKARMRRMVNIAEQGIHNRAFANKTRPADEVGTAVAKRITRIQKVNRRAGERVSAEAKRLQGKKADFSSPIQQFYDDLAEKGVEIGQGNKAILEGSDLEDTNLDRILNVVIRRLNTLGDDAAKGHKLKKFIDDQVDFEKSGDGSTVSSVERILKRLRGSVDGVLDDAFPAYKAPNDTFAETRQVLDAFEDAAGRINLESPNVEKQIGTLSRRLLSNVQSRVRLLDSLEGLDEIAAKHGVDTSDDVFALARFADELDSVFKPVARTSLNAEVQKAAKQAVTEGPGRAFIDRTIERGAERLTGVNQEEALKAIRDLLQKN